MTRLIDLVDTIDNTVSTYLVKQIVEAIGNIRWGSVEIYIQDNKIVQITERKIRKPQIEGNNQVNQKITS